MQMKETLPEWLSEIVFRLKQSHLSISVDEIGQLQFSDSLKGFLKEIISHSQKDDLHIPRSQFSAELINSGVREIEEISTAVQVVIGSRTQKITRQTVGYQFNFFPEPEAMPQNTFNTSFGLPKEFRHFTGRETELTQLRKNLAKPQLITQKISGTGGVGKSLLANYFAHQCLKEKSVQWVIWFSGAMNEMDAESALQSQFIALGMELGFDVKQLKYRTLYRAIYQRLFEEGKGLIVFDDMPSYDLVASYLPENFDQPQTATLITTRNNNYFGPDVMMIQLDVFTLGDAKQYPLRILKERISDLEAERLATTLGRYPLAMTQVIAYIANNKECIVSDYCEQYNRLVESRKAYLAKKVVGDPYEQERRERERPYEATMIAVTQMSLKQVEVICQTSEKYEQAKTVLMAAAYAAPEVAIPKKVLQGWLAEDYAELKITDALEALRSLSLIEETKESEGYQIHQVVQEVLKLDILPQDTSVNLLRWRDVIENYLTTNVTIVGMIDQKLCLKIKEHAIAIAKQLSSELPTDSILEAEGCLHQIIGLACGFQGKEREGKSHFEKGLGCYRRQSNQHSNVVGICLMQLGKATLDCGDPPNAKTQLEDALEIITANSGEGYEIGSCLQSLGMATLECGDPPSAKTKIEAALLMLKSSFGDKHVSVAGCLISYGAALIKCGHFDEAKMQLQIALSILKDAFGEKHVSVGECLLNLGSAILAGGDQHNAKITFEEALPILKANLGDKHVDVVTCFMNLGIAILLCGDTRAGKVLLEAALPILKATLGDSHSRVGECLNHLGIAILACGDPHDAKMQLETALPILRANLGDRHVDVGGCLMNLGIALRECDDPNGAKVQLENALSILKATLGEKHLKVGGCLVGLGSTISACGKPHEAIAQFEQALSILKTSLGEKHNDVGGCLMNLGATLCECGDPHGARVKLEAALQIFKATKGEKHAEIGKCLYNLGNAILRCKDPDEARVKLEAALPILKANFGHKHDIVGRCSMQLGLAVLACGDSRGAREHFEAAVPILKTASNSEDVMLGRCLMHLGVTILDCHDPQGARVQFEAALPILKTALGDRHPDVAGCLMNLGNAILACGDPHGARAQFEAALPILKTALGDRHPDVAGCLMNLGNCASQCVDLSAAIALYEDALPILKATLGARHTEVGRCLMNLGNAYLGCGNFRGAQLYQELALPILRATLGEEHGTVAHCWKSLGLAYLAFEDSQTAQSYLKIALGVYSKAYGEHHDATRACQALFHEATENAELLSTRPVEGTHTGLHASLKLSTEELTKSNRVGLTALHWAVLNKHAKHVLLLLESNGFTNVKDAQGLTALDYAIKSDQAEILLSFRDALLKKYSQLDIDQTQLPKLIRACAQYGDVAGLKLLIYLKVPVDEPGPKTGQTSLHLAVKCNSAECVELLLTAGVDPDAADKEGITPRTLADSIPSIALIFKRKLADLRPETITHQITEIPSDDEDALHKILDDTLLTLSDDEVIDGRRLYK